jgi:pantoate--beta-alanine ligase
MDILRSLDASRAACAASTSRGSLGLVPTMGALHAGHVSLVHAARRENDHVAVTVFVNPLQFGPHEDLDKYPRDEAGDVRLLEEAGADLVMFLAADEMYAPGNVTRITQGALGTTLEGAARPDHFDGVLTVVCKLFHITSPTRAYFGHKDFQQTVVVRRMVRDLDMPVEVVVCPTCRDADGLALSSRNAYLSPAERAEGLALVSCLAAVQERFAAGERSTAALEAAMREVLGARLARSPDYAAIVRSTDFSRPEVAEAGDVAVVAAPVGPTRLLDNHALGDKLGPFSALPEK